jgi:LPXTG-site transpeptidase (sortase) family protein
VSQRLLEGTTMAVLKTGLWRQPPSVKPGGAGACVIAGHRVSGQFLRLNRARTGDIVWVTSGGHKYKYRVASVSTRRVGASGLRFATGAKERLILYTCQPKWQGDKRIVVVCSRVR